jgi:hypothetical protein
VSERDKGRIEIKRGEAEILPPLEDRETDAGRIFYSTGHGSVRIVKLGPFGAMALMAGIGLVLAFSLLFLSGLLMILVPLAVLGAAGAYLSGGFRRLLR